MKDKKMGMAIRTNCELIIEKAYFQGSHRKPKFIGKQTMKVKVLRHSYGSLKGQHTFTLEVLDVIEKLDISQAHVKGDTFRIKGRNLYPNVIDHVYISDESKKASL